MLKIKGRSSKKVIDKRLDKTGTPWILPHYKIPENQRPLH